MASTRIVMPEKVKKGAVITIRATITHPMETGHRRDDVGKRVPKDIIERLAVTYDGVEIFRMDLYTGVAANPFIAFSTVATASGEVVFTWTDQHGRATVERRKLLVEG